MWGLEDGRSYQQRKKKMESNGKETFMTQEQKRKWVRKSELASRNERLRQTLHDVDGGKNTHYLAELLIDGNQTILMRNGGEKRRKSHPDFIKSQGVGDIRTAAKEVTVKGGAARPV